MTEVNSEDQNYYCTVWAKTRGIIVIPKKMVEKSRYGFGFDVRKPNGIKLLYIPSKTKLFATLIEAEEDSDKQFADRLAQLARTQALLQKRRAAGVVQVVSEDGRIRKVEMEIPKAKKAVGRPKNLSVKGQP